MCCRAGTAGDRGGAYCLSAADHRLSVQGGADQKRRTCHEADFICVQKPSHPRRRLCHRIFISQKREGCLVCENRYWRRIQIRRGDAEVD